MGIASNVSGLFYPKITIKGMIMVIDVHSHITFGLDDGAKTIAESVMMAKAAVAEGISTIVATPHHRHPSFSNKKSLVIDNVKRINEELKEKNVPLEVLAGQEIRLFGEMSEALDQKDDLLTLNNSEYILIEFPSSNIPRYTDQLFYDLLVKGYTPVIAHPERNAEIADNPDKLYRLIKNGALSQVTAASVAGSFGKKLQKLSLQMIEYDLAHVIASDAHNTSTRSFMWKPAMEVITKKLGKETVNRLNSNAEELINSYPVTKSAPERVPHKKFLGIF